jgi:hypothetical protein
MDAFPTNRPAPTRVLAGDGPEFYDDVMRMARSARRAEQRQTRRNGRTSHVEVAMSQDKKAQDWINLVLAACLFISPWIIGFSGDTSPTWNAWIVGAALAVIAIAALSMFAEWEEWVNMALGAWLIIAPWILGFTANVNAFGTHVAIGVLVAAVSAWAVWDVRRTPHAV